MVQISELRPDACVTPRAYNQLVRAIRELREAARLLPEQITGAFPIEIRRHPAGVHISLAYSERTALVELTGTLASGSNTTAKVLWYDGAWQEAETDEITIHDAIGTMEGDPGDNALVRFHRQSGQWIVWQLQC